MNDLQFVRTIRELIYQELYGRYTTLEKGCIGFVLDASRIDELINATEKQQARCLRMLEEARDLGKTLVLIQGRPCVLDNGDFVFCDAPVIYPIPNEIS